MEVVEAYANAMGQEIKNRQRYRSNRFAPKVKRPYSFELTEWGRERLGDVMVQGEVSLGDLVEFFIRKFGDEVTPEAIEATVRATSRRRAATA